MHSGSKMLQNSPKHHLGSNGGYWVCSCNHIRRNFSTPKHCITVLKLTSFSLFFMHSGSKMLLNTPKHHFRSIGGYWVCSCENIHRNFDTPKHGITIPKRTSFSLFFMHSGSETLQNTPKHHFESNGGYWVCSCENVRSNFGTPKHSIIVPKRASFSPFCVHSRSKMLQNTLKLHFGSNGGHWVCLCGNVCRNFGTPKQCIAVPKRTSSSSFCMHSGSKMLQNT